MLTVPAVMPPASAGICVGVCVGYTVIQSDCRIGAVAVNGVFVPIEGAGGFLIGEVTWELCSQGIVARGHSIEALASWSDMTWNGARQCWIGAVVDSVAIDCALAPPYLPILI